MNRDVPNSVRSNTVRNPLRGVPILAGKDALRGLKKLRFLAFFTFQKKRTKTRVFALDFFVPDHTGTIILRCKYLKHFEYTSCVGWSTFY